MRYVILLFCFCVLLSVGCSTKQQPLEKPVITVSILPQKYFTEKIVGDRFDINVMIPPGASPASYDPSPKQMANLANSAIYFKIGYIGFEINWINKIAPDFPDVKFIDSSEGIIFLESDESHGEHQHHRLEPHIWMSPEKVKVIASNILQTLIQEDEKNATFYTDNYKAFNKELDSIHALIENKLRNIRHREFIIYHPALTYFAQDYNLQQHALEIDGKEPSVQQMRELINLAKERDIKLIFVQKQFNQGEAKTLEKEINGKVVSIDPLDYNWDTQIMDIANLLNNGLK
jgi:zinc transport system substrate-binding protein